MDKVEIIESQIKDNVKKDLKSNENFTLQDMIIIFSILGGVIGTTVGIGSNELHRPEFIGYSLLKKRVPYMGA